MGHDTDPDPVGAGRVGGVVDTVEINKGTVL